MIANNNYINGNNANYINKNTIKKEIKINPNVEIYNVDSYKELNKLLTYDENEGIKELLKENPNFKIYNDYARNNSLKSDNSKTKSKASTYDPFGNYGNPNANHEFGKKSQQLIEDSTKTIADMLDILPEEISMRVATTGGNRHDVAFELWRTSSNITDFSDDLIVDRPVVHRVLWKDLDSESHSIISKVESSIDALLSDQPVGYWEELAAKEPNSHIARHLRDNFGIKFDKDGKRIQP